MEKYIVVSRNHNMLFKEMQIFSSSCHLKTQLHQEAIEIHKYEFNFNHKEEYSRLNKACYQVLCES